MAVLSYDGCQGHVRLKLKKQINIKCLLDELQGPINKALDEVRQKF